MHKYEIRPDLTISNIKKQVSDLDIFRRYVPSFERINKKFKSEFRTEELPSASITEWKGTLWYKDFGMDYKGVDWIGYLKLKFNIGFREVLELVNNDMCLGLQGCNTQPIQHTPTFYPVTDGKQTSIEYAERKLNETDKKYWYDQYKIHSRTLRFFNTVPVSHIWINDRCIQTFKPTYCYNRISTPKFNFKRKLYSPTDKMYKWTSNTTREHIQGFLQLPKTGPLLIIDKSLKDSMCIYQHLGIPAISMSSESTIPSYDIIEYLKNRFNKIIVHLDNDVAGIKYSKVINDSYNLPFFFNPANTAKDNSDFIKKYGVREFRNMFKSKIEL